MGWVTTVEDVQLYYRKDNESMRQISIAPLNQISYPLSLLRIMEPSLTHSRNKKPDPSETENITALEPGVSSRAAGVNNIPPQKQEK